MLSNRGPREQAPRKRAAPIRSACLLVLLLSAPSNLLAQSAPVSHYQKIHDDTYAANRNSYDSMASSGVGEKYYTLQYVLTGTLAMYEATNDAKYLERALSWAETMVSKATIRDSDGYLHWSGPWSAFGAKNISYFLHATQGSTELARLARMILTDPALSEKYGVQARSIEAHVAKNYVERYWKEINNWRTRTCTRKDTEATSDKPVMTSRILVDLYRISGASNYKSLAEETMNCFKARTELYRGGLVWDRKFIPSDSGLVDTAHANRLAVAMLELYDAGIVFDRSDIDSLVTTFRNLIWNGSETDPSFTNYIDGSNSAFRNREAWSNGLIYPGWAALAAYDCDAFRAVDATLAAMLGGKKNPSLSYNSTTYGYTALSGWLAKAAAQGCAGSDSDAVACHHLTPADPIPAGSGAAFDVFSGELLLRAVCTSSDVRIEAGNVSSTRYVFEDGYEWRNNRWTRIRYEGSKKIGSWIIGQATATLSRTPSELSQSNYFLAYVCHPDGEKWACGCRDSACTRSYWQLQIFGR